MKKYFLLLIISALSLTTVYGQDQQQLPKKSKSFDMDDAGSSQPQPTAPTTADDSLTKKPVSNIGTMVGDLKNLGIVITPSTNPYLRDTSIAVQKCFTTTNKTIFFITIAGIAGAETVLLDRDGLRALDKALDKLIKERGLTLNNKVQSLDKRELAIYGDKDLNVVIVECLGVKTVLNNFQAKDFQKIIAKAIIGE